MKKSRTLFTVIVAMVVMSSCGVNHAAFLNQNQNSTQVHLAGNNYTIVEKVTGSAEVNYVLFFGGVKKRQLYENAYSDMIGKANLMTGSKALVNIVTEEQFGGAPPFYTKRTITVSANVIEFNR